ncbi:reverse transcriptase domain-containing protein [Arthrobacter sp. TMS2-4]
MSISPHAYEEALRAQGGSEELLREIRKVDKACRNSKVTPIYTLGHLAFLSGVPYGRLRDIIFNTEQHYRSRTLRKKSGNGHRIIRMPDDQLKRVQRYILNNCLPVGRSSDLSYAYTTDIGILDAAKKHIGGRAVIKLDFSDFFGSISSNAVYKIFVRLGYPELLAFELALLCTCGGIVTLRSSANDKIYRVAGRRFLAQGAPTSGALSNRALQEFDEELETLKYSGYSVTRYADDITLSSIQQLSRSDCLTIIRKVDALSSTFQLSLNHRKTKILLNKSSYRILGLAVNDAGVGLSRPYKRSFQAEVYGISKAGLSKHAKFRGYSSDIEFIAHLWGHVAFARGIDPSWGQRMREELIRLNVPFLDVVGVLGAGQR